MDTPDPDSAPIFVIGSGRSGTTLLRQMLCAHPRIHLTHEASYWLWERLWPNKKDATGYVDFYIRTFSFRWLRVDPRPILEALPRPFELRHRKELYRAVMKAQAAQYGKPRYGDKTPSHAGDLARIFEDFPDARVVRIVRDPRWVIRSLNRMPWGPKGLVAGTAMVEAERKQVLPFKGRLLEVTLEELLKAPRTTMTKVLDYVGEPWDGRVMDHTRHAPDDLPPVPWFQAASQQRSTTQTYRQFSPVEVRLLERLNKQGLADFGYAPASFDEEPGRWAVFRRWASDLPETFRFAWVGLQMLRLSRIPGGGDDPRSKELGKRLNPESWELYPGFEMPEPPALPDGWEAALPTG